MNALNITIARQPFDHMVYHFVLTYSNWESVTLCASESFEALSDGLQNALWELGGVPRRHRSDSLTAAVNNLSATREFQTRYRDLLSHYGVSGQRINARQAHENGDAESSHGHFKTAVDQALLLRGSREFASREEYVNFWQQIVTTRNVGRQDRFAEEVAALKHLPETRLSSCLKVRCRVDTGSLIHIHRNTYSVHSRLIEEWVEARLFADRVEVWYADKHVGRHAAAVGGPRPSRGELPARHRLADPQTGRVRTVRVPRRSVSDDSLSPGLRPVLRGRRRADRRQGLPEDLAPCGPQQRGRHRRRLARAVGE